MHRQREAEGLEPGGPPSLSHLPLSLCRPSPTPPSPGGRWSSDPASAGNLRWWLSLLSLPSSSIGLARSTLLASVPDLLPLLPPVRQERGRERGSSLPPSSVVEHPRSVMASASLLWSSLLPSYVRTPSVAAQGRHGRHGAGGLRPRTVDTCHGGAAQGRQRPNTGER
jgi:hypothetical protein